MSVSFKWYKRYKSLLRDADAVEFLEAADVGDDDAVAHAGAADDLDRLAVAGADVDHGLARRAVLQHEQRLPPAAVDGRSGVGNQHAALLFRDDVDVDPELVAQHRMMRLVQRHQQLDGAVLDFRQHRLDAAGQHLSALLHAHRQSRTQRARVEVRQRRLDLEIVQLRHLGHQLAGGDAGALVGQQPGQHAGERRAHLRLRQLLLLLLQLLLQDRLLQPRAVDGALRDALAVGDLLVLLAQQDFVALDVQLGRQQILAGDGAAFAQRLEAAQAHAGGLQIELQQFDAADELPAFLIELQRQRGDAVFLLRQLLLDAVDRQPHGAVVQLDEQLAGRHLLPRARAHPGHARRNRTGDQLLVHRYHEARRADGIGDSAAPHLRHQHIARIDAGRDGAVDAPRGRAHGRQYGGGDNDGAALAQVDGATTDGLIHDGLDVEC